MTRNAYIMSDNINLGHVSMSTDKTITGKDRDITIGLTPVTKRHFTKITSVKNKSDKFNNIKAYCQ